MALTKDTPRGYASHDQGDTVDLPVKNAVQIFEGAAVMENESTGYMIPLTGTGTSDGFVGFAERQADNRLGAAGAIRVKTRTKGIVELTVAGSSVATNGAAVYASDDGTFTVTSSNAKKIGTILCWLAGEINLVKFYAYNQAQPALA
ncbi:MAG: cytoplasmic protein [Candidatus Omnitrophica bacterium]|jgi:hypothetical protein|nr:cytoplasmic protein [Candidatus Omnitrophota bacterium]